MSYLWCKKRRGGVKEGPEEIRSTLEPADLASRDTDQVRGMERGEIGQRIALEIGPEHFDRIELGGVGRQPRRLQASAVKEIGDDPRPMPWQPVPDEDERTAHMAAERARM